MKRESEHQIALRNAQRETHERKVSTENQRKRRELELKEEANEIAKKNSKKVTVALVISFLSLALSSFAIVKEFI